MHDEGTATGLARHGFLDKKWRGGKGKLTLLILSITELGV